MTCASMSPAGAALAAYVVLQRLTDMVADARVRAATEHLKVDNATVDGISAADASAAAAFMTEAVAGAIASRGACPNPFHERLN